MSQICFFDLISDLEILQNLKYFLFSLLVCIDFESKNWWSQAFWTPVYTHFQCIQYTFFFQRFLKVVQP